MGNITDVLPQESATVQAIYDHHKRVGDSEPPRQYLGASIIGHECDRYLWYLFRLAFKAKFDGRMHRLFETGHKEEERVYADLRAIGYDVRDVDERGEQFACSFAAGHGGGHCDGFVLGVIEALKTWHVLEIKTFGGDENESKDFEKVKKDGVEIAKPIHYAQQQTYLGQFGLTRSLYFCKKKSTDELHTERVKFDKKKFDAIIYRAERIIKASEPPERMAPQRPDFYKCQWCDARAICWGSQEIAVPLDYRSCRTCVYATPEFEAPDGTKLNNGTWTCSQFTAGQWPDRGEIAFDRQCQGCDKHLLIPGLVTFAKPVDAGEDFIEFENIHDGVHWFHGNGEGQYSTDELMHTAGPLDAEKHKALMAVKDTFGGRVVDSTPFDEDLTLIEMYPPEDSRVLWYGAVLELNEATTKHLPNVDFSKPSGVYKDDEYNAWEYEGKYLVVMYLKNDGAAIFEGVE